MITITFIPSDIEILSGIPKTVEIETSQPATVYYTLDGTLPSPLSTVYVGTITMPTDVGEVILSAVAYYVDSFSNLVPSPVLSEVYFTDQSALDRYRNIFFEGVVYIFNEGDRPQFPLYFDENGEAVNFLNVETDQLDFIVSETDPQGNPIVIPGVPRIAPAEETSTHFDDNPVEYSSVNGTELFNPDALFIEIDGRRGARPQQVDLVNGPHMSLRDSRKNYGGVDYIDAGGTNYVSGSSTRPLISREKGLIVFYYFDSNSSRWIKSIQQLPAAPTGLPSPNFQAGWQTFHWFQFGRQSDGMQ